ncbi:unnamed protein product [Mesocestoides corti]|uniref:C2H2-type domain-containing protein n=1 Tax=Mesocestoides corti TaxID=53468 RepID=A0A158QTB9_MESCO|nr:unnamed protein product [Mesocestoides corti]
MPLLLSSCQTTCHCPSFAPSNQVPFESSQPSPSSVAGTHKTSPNQNVHLNKCGLLNAQLPSLQAINGKNGSPEIQSTATIAIYRQYYSDVLAYFKTLLDNLDDGRLSTLHPNENMVASATQGGKSLENDPWGQSKTIMAGYFRRNGARDWCWSSWHNYLSWISRTHPEWFQLFTECSKQMGIDWDVMYQKWMASQPNSKDQAPMFDLSRPPPTSASNPEQAPPPPITNPFSLTSVPPPTDPRVWCEDCGRYLPTQRAYDIHLRGVCHIQNALTKAITDNASTVLDIPPPLWTPQIHPLPSQSVMSRNKPIADLRPCQKPQLRLQHLLDICIQPLVGLNYVTEFQRRGLLECIYRHHYPLLYQLILLDKSDKAIKTQRLASYAQQVECNEGRKRPSIMVEKENSTLKTSTEVIAAKKPPTSMATSPLKLVGVPSHPASSVASEPSPKPPEPTAQSLGSFVQDEAEEEIEEGEMLDYSSSSEDEDEKDSNGCAEKRFSTHSGLLSSPQRPIFDIDASSPSSSHFSDEGDEPDDTKLPNFFSTGDDDAKISIGGPVVYLPDFEVGFISERPLLPNFTKTDEFFTFVDNLTKKGVLGVHRPNANVNLKDQQIASPAPTDAQLAQSFEEEVHWALKQMEGASQRENPIHFTYNKSKQIPHPPPSRTPTTPNAVAQGKSIEVISSSSSTKLTRDIRPVPLESLPEPQWDPSELRQAARVFLAKLEGRPPPPPSPQSSSPAPQIPMQTIPVLMSNQPRAVLPQPPPLVDVNQQRWQLVETPKIGVLGDPPKRPRLDEEGVKNLLSSPLDALQALLKGRLSRNQFGRPDSSQSPSQTSSPSPAFFLPSRSTEIFDGYSYFSQQEAAKVRENSPAPPSFQQRRNTMKSNFCNYHHKSQSETTPNPSSSRCSRGSTSNSKLAAFADMLGMNEPPAPSRDANSRNPMAPGVPPASASLIAAGLNPAAWLASSTLWRPNVIPPAANSLNPSSFMLAAGMFRHPLLQPPNWKH